MRREESGGQVPYTMDKLQDPFFCPRILFTLHSRFLVQASVFKPPTSVLVFPLKVGMCISEGGKWEGSGEVSGFREVIEEGGKGALLGRRSV